jgi:hypothetical protein
MKYQFTKRSLRAKIILDTYGDLKKAYIVAGSCEALAESIKNLPVETFSTSYGLGENEVKDLFYDSSLLAISKSLRAALGGHYEKGVRDCDFVPVMNSDELENIRLSGLEKHLIQNSSDRVLDNIERKFIFDYYSNGKSLVQVHRHYLRHCEGGDYVTCEKNFKPISLNALYQVVHRARESGELKSRKIDWKSEVGDMALWIKALEFREKKGKYLKNTFNTLTEHLDEDLGFTYIKMCGFFDQPKQKEISKNLLEQLENSDY